VNWFELIQQPAIIISMPAVGLMHLYPYKKQEMIGFS